MKRRFKALTKDDILQPYISENDFKSSNDGDKVGYNLYSSDIRYQKNFESAQPIKVEFKFSENLPARLYGYGFVSTNRLVSISSDGQRHFDLIQVILNFFITTLFSFKVNSDFFSNDSLYLSGKLSIYNSRMYH